MINELHIVIGANGNAGNAILERLVELNKNAVGITRNGKLRNHKLNEKVKSISGDILTPDGLDDAVKNATHIYNAAIPPYHEWVNQLPLITQNCIKLAKLSNAKLIVVDNLYMYDSEQTSNLIESTPNTSTTKKGEIRAMIAKKYLAAHKENGVNVVIVRGSDFYGPGVRNALLGEQLFTKAIKGKKFMIFGDINQLHTFTYIPDFAKAIVNIATSDNKELIYHAPNANPITQKEILSILAKELGKQLKYTNPGYLTLSFFGLFNKGAKEFKEMLYQFNQEFIVNHERYTSEFGGEITEMSDGLKETIRWYKSEYDLLN